MEPKKSFQIQRHKSKFQNFINQLINNNPNPNKNNTIPNNKNKSPRHNSSSISNNICQIQKTKTLKKYNYFESNMKSLSQQQLCQQQKIQLSSQSSQYKKSQMKIPNVLNELQSYMKQKNEESPWIKKYNWQQILVSSSKQSNKTKTIIHNNNANNSGRKQQQLDNSFDSDIFFNIYNKTNISQQHKSQHKSQHKQQKQQQLSISSRTQSIKSSRTCKLSSLSKQHSNKSQRSCNSSQIMNLLLQNNKHKQLSPSINQPLSYRRRKNYIDDDNQDDFNQLMYYVEQQNQKRLQQYKQKVQSKQHQLSSNQLIIQKKKSYFNIQSPQPSPNKQIHIQKNKSFLNIQSPQLSPSNKRTTIHKVPHQKNKNHNQINYSFLTDHRKSQFKAKRLKKQIQQEPNCSICLCQVDGRSKLPCKHSFCRQCLLDWLAKTSNCPNCRKNATHYIFNNQKFPIQQKQYSLQNYVDNIGSDNDEQGSLDYQCYNCDQTNEGDQLLICDKCFLNASHIQCDPALNRKVPPADRSWYCHMCRRTPTLWHREKRDYY